jgi:uncharacterized coiled-coil protein SlyX
MTPIEKAANARLDELIDQKLGELEIMLADKGGTDDEIAEGVAYQREEFERCRAELLDWLRRVEAAGDVSPSSELN